MLYQMMNRKCVKRFVSCFGFEIGERMKGKLHAKPCRFLSLVRVDYPTYRGALRSQKVRNGTDRASRSGCTACIFVAACLPCRLSSLCLLLLILRQLCSVVTDDSKKFRKKAIKAAKENFLFDIDALDESLTEQSWSVLFSSAQNLFKTHTQENEKLIFQAYGIENPNDFSIINPTATPAKTTMAAAAAAGTRIDQTSDRLDQTEKNQTGSDRQQTPRLEDVGMSKAGKKGALEQNREEKEGPKDTMASTSSPLSTTNGSTDASDGQQTNPDNAKRVQHRKKPAEKKSRRIHSDRRTSPRNKRRTS